MARKKTTNTMENIVFQNINTVDTNTSPESAEYQDIPASKIVASPYNEGLDMDRVNEYAKSMVKSGLLSPITVYDMGDGTYQILTGHQRFEAWCNVLGNSTIRCIVREYEKDPMKRFIAHTESNTLKRNLDLKFWLSRIAHAKEVLKETGFSGSREEEMKLLSSMLNGISVAQLFRYEGFSKLIPELQALESKRWLSANTLYAAVSLGTEQQKEVADRVMALYYSTKQKNDSLECEFEITREEFKKLVNDVKAGNSFDPAAKPKKVSTYEEKLDKAKQAFFKSISAPKNKAQKEKVLEAIKQCRIELDELESRIK